jgi:hypothetical protein
VRPRALLNVTAICLLLAAATVWAPPAPPAAAAAKKPATWRKPTAWQKAASAARPQLELLRKVSGLSGVSIVEGTVKRFSQDFEAGARNPDRFLSEVKLSQPTLVSEWQNTPREKRIFVIGAGKDSATVTELTKSLKSDGYTAFFTSFCGQSGALCSSKAVGAFFGTAGSTMLYHTTSAERSAERNQHDAKHDAYSIRKSSYQHHAVLPPSHCFPVTDYGFHRHGRALLGVYHSSLSIVYGGLGGPRCICIWSCALLRCHESLFAQCI